MTKGWFFEFITTYGWAIIVVLMVIGLMAYFGVFKIENMPGITDLKNKTNSLHESCTEICESHNWDMMPKYLDRNPVCYCSDEQGAIWTFIMR